MTPRPATRWRPVAIAALAAGVLALAAVTLYPGWYSYDSAWQLMQARTRTYSDLQPPLMQVVWTWLLDAGWPPGSLMVVHLGALAAGTALLALSVRRPACALLPLVLLWPPFLVLFGHLWNDVSMAAGLTLATGWIAWSRAAGHGRLGWLALLPLAFAIGVRHNAIVAAVPLFVLMLDRASGAPQRKAPRVALGVALALAALGGSAVLSRAVVVRPMPSWTSMPIWDLSAASIATGELLLPAGMHGPGLTVDELRPLVNPDTSMTILVGAKSGVDPGIDAPLPEEVRRELLGRWLRLPFTHPTAWLAHRGAIAWSLLGPQRADKVETLFIVPQVVAFQDNPPIRANASEANARLLGLVRAMKTTPLCTPLAYLLLAALAAGLAMRPRFAGDRALVLALAASAWLHALHLPLIVPAAEWRYLLWSMLAGVLAFLLSLGGGAAPARPSPPH